MNAFRLLAFGSIAAVFGLIIFGGVVRITGSGMGCGPDWPLCNGEAVPSVWTMETTLEYFHRIFALLVILFIGVLLIAGWRRRRENAWFFRIPLIAAGFVMLQSGLGAVTVLLDLHAEVTTAHHGIAQGILATLIVLGVLTFGSRLSPEYPAHQASGGSRVSRAGIVAGVSTLALLLAGAYTATSGASYACPEWPLCDGYYVPGTGSIYVDTQLVHRWLAMITALAVGYLIYEVYRQRAGSRLMTRLSLTLGGLLLLQIMVGAANIWTQIDQGFAALHLILATLIWGLLITIVTIDRMLPAPGASTAAAVPSERTGRAAMSEIGD